MAACSWLPHPLPYGHNPVTGAPPRPAPQRPHFQVPGGGGFDTGTWGQSRPAAPTPGGLSAGPPCTHSPWAPGGRGCPRRRPARPRLSGTRGAPPEGPALCPLHCCPVHAPAGSAVARSSGPGRGQARPCAGVVGGLRLRPRTRPADCRCGRTGARSQRAARGLLGCTAPAPEGARWRPDLIRLRVKRGSLSDAQAREHTGVCRGKAAGDLPAPGKLNISSHYDAATERAAR